MRATTTDRAYAASVTDAPPLVIQTEHLEDEAIAWIADRCRHVKCASDETVVIKSAGS